MHAARMKKQTLMIAGGMMLLVGLVIGFVPVSTGGSSCGSAFVASNDAQIDDYTSLLLGESLRGATRADDCASATSMWRVPALALAIPGGLLLLAGLSPLALAPLRENPPEVEPQEVEPQEV